MDWSGYAALGVALLTALWAFIDRAQREGEHNQVVAQLRLDVDHAHERCRVLESASHDASKYIAVLSTKVDNIASVVAEIKSILEEMRPKPRKQA